MQISEKEFRMVVLLKDQDTKGYDWLKENSNYHESSNDAMVAFLDEAKYAEFEIRFIEPETIRQSILSWLSHFQHHGQNLGYSPNLLRWKTLHYNIDGFDTHISKIDFDKVAPIKLVEILIDVVRLHFKQM